VRAWLNSLLKARRDWQQAILYVAPSVLIMAALVGFPIVFSLYSSFHKVSFWRGETRFEFVGLKNYIRIFTSSFFWHSLVRTVEYSLLRVGGAFILGFAVALLMNQAGRAAQVFKNIFILPWAISYVANAIMWQWLYHGSYGVLNEVLLRLGFIDSYVSWLSSSNTALLAVAVMDIWKNVPFSALIIYAGLRTVPADLYDAARVDGANSLQRLWYVTVPTIRPILATVVIVQSIWAMKVFDSIWTLTKGGFDTAVLNIYAFRQSFTYLKLGYGSAIAYVLTLLILIVVLLLSRFVRGEEKG